MSPCVACAELTASMTLDLRRDLAATRVALQRADDTNAALRRQVEQQQKLLRLMQAEMAAAALRIETIARELKA